MKAGGLSVRSNFKTIDSSGHKKETRILDFSLESSESRDSSAEGKIKSSVYFDSPKLGVGTVKIDCGENEFITINNKIRPEKQKAFEFVLKTILDNKMIKNQTDLNMLLDCVKTVTALNNGDIKPEQYGDMLGVLSGKLHHLGFAVGTLSIKNAKGKITAQVESTSPFLKNLWSLGLHEYPALSKGKSTNSMTVLTKVIENYSKLKQNKDIERDSKYKNVNTSIEESFSKDSSILYKSIYSSDYSQSVKLDLSASWGTLPSLEFNTEQSTVIHKVNANDLQFSIDINSFNRSLMTKDVKIKYESSRLRNIEKTQTRLNEILTPTDKDSRVLNLSLFDNLRDLLTILGNLPNKDCDINEYIKECLAAKDSLTEIFRYLMGGRTQWSDLDKARHKLNYLHARLNEILAIREKPLVPIEYSINSKSESKSHEVSLTTEHLEKLSPTIYNVFNVRGEREKLSGGVNKKFVDTEVESDESGDCIGLTFAKKTDDYEKEASVFKHLMDNNKTLSNSINNLEKKLQNVLLDPKSRQELQINLKKLQEIKKWNDFDIAHSSFQHMLSKESKEFLKGQLEKLRDKNKNQVGHYQYNDLFLAEALNNTAFYLKNPKAISLKAISEALNSDNQEVREQAQKDYPLPVRLNIMKQVSLIGASFNRIGIAHRDIHDGNVFVLRLKDGSYKVIFIDFGNSTLEKEELRPRAETTAYNSLVNSIDKKPEHKSFYLEYILSTYGESQQENPIKRGFENIRRQNRSEHDPKQGKHGFLYKDLKASGFTSAEARYLITNLKEALQAISKAADNNSVDELNAVSAKMIEFENYVLKRVNEMCGQKSELPRSTTQGA